MAALWARVQAAAAYGAGELHGMVGRCGGQSAAAARNLHGAAKRLLFAGSIDSESKTFANAYDLVINGNEIGGGSIRIHDKELQQKVFSILGFSEKEADDQFGFLLNAFKYGAPPHGGIAFGLDRLVAVMNNDETIRDYIAFPKNNSGRDVMIDSPSKIDNQQLDDLNIKLN